MTLALICLPSEPVCRKKRVSNEELAERLDALERTHEWQFERVHEAIEQLQTTRGRRRKSTGFREEIRKKRKARVRKNGG